MIREFAFYCPELDCIVIQIIFNQCQIAIAFEFSHDYLAQAYQNTIGFGVNDPLEVYSLMPLGEV